MSRPLALVAAAVLAACRPQLAMVVDGTLAFDPTQLAMGDVYEGHLRAHELDLVLSSTAPCDDVRLSIPGDFTVDEGTTLSLAGSERKRLTVRPPASGLRLHEGVLTATGCGLSASVMLSATLVARPSCASASACRTARFELSTGACVEDSVADGTPCSDTCLEAAACRAGECRGQAKSCDDGDACTLDVCSAGTGCQNVSAGTLCPPPAQCPSACLGPACPMGNAQLLWSLPTQDELGAPYVSLAADDDGNLYWLEQSQPTGGPYTTILVSASPTGRLRYRRSFLHSPGSNGYLTPMIVGGTVLLSPDGFGSRAYAFRASDGQLLWEARLKTLFGLPSTVPTWVDHGASLGDGSVVFPLTFGSGGPAPAAIAALDLETGKLKWSQSETAVLWAIAADEEQNVFADPSGPTVISRERGGKFRFSAPVVTFNAISSGRVYSQDEAVNASDGKLAYRFNATAYVNIAGASLGVRSPDSKKLEVFRTTDGAVRGAIDLSPAYAQDLMLTAEDHVLLVSGAAGEAPVLRAYDSDAAQQFSCRLPGVGPYRGPGVLRDGKYFVLEQPTADGKGTLRAFLVAGQSLATRGWATGHGTSARARRPATGP